MIIFDSKPSVVCIIMSICTSSHSEEQASEVSGSAFLECQSERAALAWEENTVSTLMGMSDDVCNRHLGGCTLPLCSWLQILADATSTESNNK